MVGFGSAEGVKRNCRAKVRLFYFVGDIQKNEEKGYQLY